jgi:hypothetical protein
MARIPEQVITAVNESAKAVSPGSSASLHVSRDGAFNQRVADLIAAADRIQYADPSFRQELAEWIHPNFTQKTDGMTGANLGINDVASVVGPWVTRTFDLGKLRAARDKNLCLEAPGLIILHGEDTIRQWIEVGELLEHVLLTLTKNSVQYSFFNMLIEVPDLRTTLRSMLSIPSWPQLLLRIGYCLQDPAPSSRRSVEEVTMGNDYGASSTPETSCHQLPGEEKP